MVLAYKLRFFADCKDCAISEAKKYIKSTGENVESFAFSAKKIDFNTYEVKTTKRKKR